MGFFDYLIAFTICITVIIVVGMICDTITKVKVVRQIEIKKGDQES